MYLPLEFPEVIAKSIFGSYDKFVNEYGGIHYLLTVLKILFCCTYVMNLLMWFCALNIYIKVKTTGKASEDLV